MWLCMHILDAQRGLLMKKGMSVFRKARDSKYNPPPGNYHTLQHRANWIKLLNPVVSAIISQRITKCNGSMQRLRCEIFGTRCLTDAQRVPCRIAK